jgi:NADP-dependent 3-hydroxy acid dehydrogenase YdfG
VVTGGGSGIGTMIATAYVQNGAKVYIASRKEKQLKEVRATLLVSQAYLNVHPRHRSQIN